jgi:hypothetical protein
MHQIDRLIPGFKVSHVLYLYATMSMKRNQLKHKHKTRLTYNLTTLFPPHTKNIYTITA